MSWSFYVEPTPIPDFDAAIDAARAAAQTNIEQSNRDGADQADQAVAAAKALVASGVVGPPTARVSASLSGHGNPGHGPTPGWANDQVTVMVNQAGP